MSRITEYNPRRTFWLAVAFILAFLLSPFWAGLPLQWIYGADTLMIGDAAGDTAIIKDTYLQSSSNLGTLDYMQVDNYAATLQGFLGDMTYYDSIGLGQNIIAASCTITVYEYYNPDTLFFYGVWEYCWDEFTATWTYSQTDSEWTTAGCASADDGGSPNCSDGAGYDRTATPVGAAYIEGTGDYGIDIDTSYVNALYNAGVPVSYLLSTKNGEFYGIRTGERAGEGDDPKFVYIYQAADGGAAKLWKFLK